MSQRVPGFSKPSGPRSPAKRQLCCSWRRRYPLSYGKAIGNFCNVLPSFTALRQESKVAKPRATGAEVTVGFYARYADYCEKFVLSTDAKDGLNPEYFLKVRWFVKRRRSRIFLPQGQDSVWSTIPAVQT